MLSIQSESANITSLEGCRVESMIAVVRLFEDLPDEPIVIWMKIEEGNWHRIFIDAGILFWDEMEELDQADMEETEGIDHLQLMPIPDTITDVQFRHVGENSILSIEFGSGRGWRMVEDKHSERSTMNFWQLEE